MYASLRLFAALSVVPLWFLTTDSLLGESPQQQDRSGLLTSLKSLQIIVEEVKADARKAGITESDFGQPRSFKSKDLGAEPQST
jgi:hypothetical protein